jgi:hypothetical protein
VTAVNGSVCVWCQEHRLHIGPQPLSSLSLIVRHNKKLGWEFGIRTEEINLLIKQADVVMYIKT